MKKIITIITTILFSMAFLALAGCINKEPLVIKQSDTYIIIKASNEQMDITNNTTLVDYMNSLKDNDKLNFEIENGMVCSINGIENPADWSSCWMLYTSDTENANTAWGTIEYQGNIYGSSMFGAELLNIKDGCIYIWVFQSFN